MTANKILSICIPTYKRRNFLKECLESITSQFSDKDIFEKTEIVISDNCSEDGTEELVKELQKQFSNIMYVKNQKNMGFDFNVLQVVEKASGQYCWLLGDDDALYPGSLKIVIEEIEKSRLSYYLANSWGHDHKLQKPQGQKPTLDITSNQTFAQLEDFVRSIPSFMNAVGYFGGMSAQIFKKEIWDNFADKQKYQNTQVVHFYTILITMQHEKMMLFKEPLVKTRAENINWAQVPGFETEDKRTEKTKRGVIWLYGLYNIPYSKLALSWFFFKSKLRNRLVYFIKNILKKLKTFSGQPST